MTWCSPNVQRIIRQIQNGVWHCAGAHAEAEAAYVACGQPGDAVEMWVALRDYEAAARVAEQWRLPSLPDILAAQVCPVLPHRHHTHSLHA